MAFAIATRILLGKTAPSQAALILAVEMENVFLENAFALKTIKARIVQSLFVIVTTAVNV